MFSFASKMLNTIMGTEEDGMGGPGSAMQQPGQQQGVGMRPAGVGGMGGFPRPGVPPGQRPYGGAPTFSGPRPTASPLRGPPLFGGSSRAPGPGTPHRFSGPQPAPGQQPLQRPQPQPGGFGAPSQPQQQQQIRAPQQQQQQQVRQMMPSMRQRLPQPQQTYPQHLDQQGAPLPDLSHLSAEERAMIENVMAKAQQLEQDVIPPHQPPHHPQQQQQPGVITQQQHLQQQQPLPQQQQQQMRPKDQGRFSDNLCPLCHTRDVRDGANECSVCRTLVCNRCGALATHPETKRPEWTCGNCIKMRRARQQQQQQQHQVSSQMEWEDGGRNRVGQQQQQQQQPQPPRGWTDESEFNGGREREYEEEEEDKSSWIQSPPSIGSSSGGGGRGVSLGGTTIPAAGANISSYSNLPESDLISPLTPESQPLPSMSTSSPLAKPSSFAKLHSRSLSLEDEDEYEQVDYGRYDRRVSITPPPSPQERQQPPNFAAQQQETKTQNLMDEFTKLQSAVESYSTKRVEKQYVRSPSPPFEQTPSKYDEYDPPYKSPSPPIIEEVVSPVISTSPLPSPISLIQSPPEGFAPQYYGGGTTITSGITSHGGGGSQGMGMGGTSKFPKERKSIVMSELDDYPSSTEESEEEVESDEEINKKKKKKKIKDTSGDYSSSDYYNKGSGSYGSSSDSGGGGGGSSSHSHHNIVPNTGGLTSSTGLGNISGISEDIMNLYQHSPGEVYTIPEEEDEGGSPTGADLVTSLSNRPGMVGDSFSGQQQHNVIRPQLRPQRSLDNRLPSSQIHQQQPQIQYRTPLDHQHHQQQQQPQHHQMIDTQGNLAYATNNNTQQQQLQQQTSMHGHLGGVGGGPAGDYTQQQQQQPHTADFHSISPQPPHSALTQQQQQMQKTVDNINQWNLNNQLGLQQPFTSRVPTSMDSVSLPYTQPQLEITQQTSYPDQQQQQQQPLLGPQFPQQSQQLTQPIQPGQQQQQPLLSQPGQPPPTQQTQQQPYFQQNTMPSQQQQQQIQQQQLIAQQLLQTQQQLDAQAAISAPQQQQPPWAGPGDTIRSTSPFPPSQQQQPQLQQQYLGGMSVQVPPPTGQPSDQFLAPSAAAAAAAAGQNKSISGLIADFSRALGLGASPRPSPTDEKLDMFGLRPSPVIPTSSRPQPYDQFLQPIPQRPMEYGLTPEQLQQQQPLQHTLIQPAPSSAFASLEHQQVQPSSAYQQQQQALSQFQGILQQQAQSHAMTQLTHPHPSLSQAHSQPQSILSDYNIVHPSLMSQQGVVVAGVGVVPGGLSPSQAYMYQQQMAMQHQQQHLKKSSRRAHFPGASTDIRRDLSSSALLVGQIPSSGVTLTPNVLMQPLAVTPLGGTTPTVLTPVGTPRSGRDLAMAYDSSDTMSETDSQKSLRMRRKLPCLPPDQEAAPLPSSKKRERQRAQETFRAMSPSYRIDERSFPLSNLSRPSASESNLRKLAMDPTIQIQRPGSALGLLQGSSILSTVPLPQQSQMPSSFPMSSALFSSSPSLFPSVRLRTTTSGYTHPTELTTTTSVLSGLYPSYKTWDSWSSNMAELAACLPPDLRHLLHRKDDPTATYSQLTESEFPSYINQLREQLQEERRQLLADERKRLEALRERDRELGSRLSSLSLTSSRDLTTGDRSRAELSRNVGLSRSAGASPILSRKLKGHRRQLSDPKVGFLPFSPIKEDGDNDLADPERGGSSSLLMHLRGIGGSSLTSGMIGGSGLTSQQLHHFGSTRSSLPYKSYEYESLQDSNTGPSLFPPMLGEWDRSQSYLAPSSYSSAGGILRETAISSLTGGLSSGDDDLLMLRSTPTWNPRRRKSEGELLWATVAGGASGTGSMPRSKRHSFRKHRKSRSWHPSPYMSEEDEEEEDLLNREEKKARIKAEIARRRQQLYKSATTASAGDFDGTRVLEGERHSVLKSVDQLLRDQYEWEAARHYNRQLYGVGGSVGGGHYIVSPTASEEDKSIERIASTFRSTGVGTSALLIDDSNNRYSCWNEDLHSMDTESLVSELGATPSAMPLLPDMPTRSRRILEDLGSVPLIGGGGGGSSAGVQQSIRQSSGLLGGIMSSSKEDYNNPSSSSGVNFNHYYEDSTMINNIPFSSAATNGDILLNIEQQEHQHQQQQHFQQQHQQHHQRLPRLPRKMDS